MAATFTRLRVDHVPGTDRWKLAEDCIYRVGSADSDDTVLMKEGFETDFGSVPQALWWLVNPHGPATPAYVLHDWLYHTGQRNRFVSDAILMEALEVCGVGGFQRWMIYKGVRMGGWFAWRKHRRLEKKAQKRLRLPRK